MASSRVLIAVFSVICGVVVSMLVEAGEGADKEGARKEGARGVAGLQPGDRFLCSVRYSHKWQEAELIVERPGALAPRGPRPPRSPATPRPPRAGRGAGGEVSVGEVQVRAVPRADDPLLVDMTLAGEIIGAGELTLVPRLSRVHYFDGRGRDWTVFPGRKGQANRARRILETVGAQWRAGRGNALEKEMLEEQMLGAALALLHEAELEVRLKTPDAAARLPNLDGLLSGRVSAALPDAVKKQVARFYSELLVRVITPAAADAENFRKGAKFEVKKVAYRVDKVTPSKGSAAVAVRGTTPRSPSGHSLRETVVFDARTGLVLHATAVTLEDAVRSTRARAGAERWETKLVSFRRKR